MGGRPPRVIATPAKSTKRPREENEGSRAGERRRWDFDRPLAPASQAGGRTNESSKERVPVLARPRRRSTSTLCAARTASKRHSWSPSSSLASMARLPYTAPDSESVQGRSCTGKPDRLRFRMHSCASSSSKALCPRC